MAKLRQRCFEKRSSFGWQHFPFRLVLKVHSASGMEFKTEAEAVSFAIADRPSDQNNHNVDKSGGKPFSRSEIERLLQTKGYKEYHRFRFYAGAGQKAEGWTELVLCPITQNPKAEQILEDFVQRAKTEFVDKRFQAFHAEVVMPVFEALKTNLLTLEIKNRVIFAKAFSGQAFGGVTLSEEEVLRRLRRYASEYFAPLTLESTSKGQWRFDKAHVSDPDNPHSYDHLHVYHRLFPYHTTIRVTPI